MPLTPLTRGLLGVPRLPTFWPIAGLGKLGKHPGNTWIRIAKYVTPNTWWNTCENTCEYVPYGHAALPATPAHMLPTYSHVFAHRRHRGSGVYCIKTERAFCLQIYLRTENNNDTTIIMTLQYETHPELAINRNLNIEKRHSLLACSSPQPESESNPRSNSRGMMLPGNLARSASISVPV